MDSTLVKSAKKVISNSEVSTFLKCERRHHYAHTLNIRPKRYGDSLSRGIIGHDALAAYYMVLQERPNDYDAARTAAFDTMVPYIESGKADGTLIGPLAQLLREYFEHYENRDSFKIVAVEKSLKIPLGGDDFDYGMRLDLLVEMTEGKYHGELILMDHKFVYNFWSEDQMMLNSQIPKYIGTLRANNVPVKRAFINQLRWREVKSNPERFRRETITPTDTEILNIMMEQYEASQQILNMDHKPLRTIDSMTCRNCPYIVLCRQELIGSDPKLLIETEFERNDYNDSYAQLAIGTGDE